MKSGQETRSHTPLERLQLIAAQLAGDQQAGK
jgi:hypothetical protein